MPAWRQRDVLPLSSPSALSPVSTTLEIINPPNSWRPIVVAIVSAVTIGLFIALGTLVYKLLLRPSRPQSSDVIVCQTESCKQYGQQLASSVDLLVDPCENFYLYSCGNWKREHSSSVFREHMDLFVDNLASDLGYRDVPVSDQNTEQKASKFFKTCHAAATEPNSREDEHFRTVLREAGVTWPHFSLAPNVLLTMWNIYNILDIQTLLVMRPDDHYKRHILLKPPAALTDLLSRKQLLEREQRDMRVYKFFANAFRSDENGSVLAMSFEEFRSLEERILLRLIPASVHGTSKSASFANIETYFPAAKRENWKQVLQAVDVVQHSEDAFVALIESQEYLRTLSDVIRTESERAVHLYVGWIAVQALARYMDHEFAAEYDGSEARTEHIATAECLRMTEKRLGWAVYSGFVRNKMSNALINDLKAMFQTIYTAYLNIISSSVSLDFNATLAAKGSNTDAFLRHYETFLNKGVFKNIYSRFPDMNSTFCANWIRSVQCVRSIGTSRWAHAQTFFIDDIREGYYSFGREDIIVPPYVNMYPLYESYLPYSVKYGALGSVVAIALTKNFVSTSKSTDYHVNETVQCLGRTSTYSSTLRNLDSKDVASGTALVDFLWNAYQSAAASTDEKNIRLHEFTDHTANQTFFVTFCHLRCSNLNDNAEAYCNEALRQSQFFSESFLCPRGTRMHPRKRCQLFDQFPEI
ncbi:neprilysin-1-like [Ornithodoros turicata]|uniref:neprilysin-1-like n=1 Tax=Ornithodoros turicata TaxID=34597 RepID=UPI0031390C1A